jgi:(S)-sulfolactate dehydrogenase
MTEILITEYLDPWAVEELQRDFDVVYDPTLVDRPEALASLVPEVPALIVRNRTQLRGPMLDAARHLKVIGRLGVGLDNIDMAACAGRGISVFPATGANAVSVAEYVIAAALVASRNIWQASTYVLAGRWPRNQLMLGEVAGKRIGLVGFGDIARLVAVRANALGMSVAATGPRLTQEDPLCVQYGITAMPLDQLVAWSDILSLHAPLLPETRHLIDRAALARMKPGALLINTARGGLVDEAALVAALRGGHLGAAVLDVFEEEPLKPGSIFEGVPNLWLTPHVSGVTEQANRRVASITIASVRRALGKG